MGHVVFYRVIILKETLGEEMRSDFVLIEN